jgi:hypothetical protein
MNYFVEATGGNTPILIKDIFDNTGFSEEKLCAISVNGSKKIITDDAPEVWFYAMQALSEATNGNLSNVPIEDYQFHLFCIPLKCLTQDTIKRQDVMKRNDDQDVDLISISSLASLEEDKIALSKHAMVMFFLCKKKKQNKNFDKNKSRKSMFGFNLDSDPNGTKIRTKFLIQALHDVSDIFGAHHEKIFAR